MKTRVTDRTYEALQTYMEAGNYSSEARAVADLLDLALFGAVGSVPKRLACNSHEMAVFGMKTA